MQQAFSLLILMGLLGILACDSDSLAQQRQPASLSAVEAMTQGGAAIIKKSSLTLQIAEGKPT